MEILDLNRVVVFNDYSSAIIKNKEKFIKGDIRACKEYIYTNQREDAINISNKFYKFNNIRVISIMKRTKVGMDGLGIEIAKNMTTHPDDNFCLHRNNVFFITGMSNKAWEDDMKDKIPNCFQDNVLHHGKLQMLKDRLSNIKNALIIIDEIDCGDKELQKMHTILEKSKILDIEYMIKNNVRFVVVSATIIDRLRVLEKWGNHHSPYFMTIPDSYIGHKEFLEMDIIREFYPLDSIESAERWIQEDILDNYICDYRVHIVRTDKDKVDFISEACNKKNISFKNHTSTDRISHEELLKIFGNITKHIVIAVKGFWRRANLIPDNWKMKIGATHELYVSSCDENVQVQGLPGRMTGYWKEAIFKGHKTGPYRTSVKAIRKYEEALKNPIEFIHNNNKISKPNIFLNPKNIANLTPIHQAVQQSEKRVPIIIQLHPDAAIFTMTKRYDKIKFIKDLLNTKVEYKKLLDYINRTDVICSKISKPMSPLSWKRHIEWVVKAWEKKEVYGSLDLKEDQKVINNWQLFIDIKEYRLCFVIWCINPEYYS